MYPPRLLTLTLLLTGLVLSSCAGMKERTKQASPEGLVTYSLQNGSDASLEVFYNRPSKKGRVIFGELVPFGEVWRTGANEATTFTTNVPLLIGGQELPEGKYTIWTIPGPSEWTVIFNTKMYSWGVSWGGKASRDPDHDELSIKVPVEILQEVTEMFTIDLRNQDPVEMHLMWDQTRVVVPMYVK